jgi:hypothetical protein
MSKVVHVNHFLLILAGFVWQSTDLAAWEGSGVEVIPVCIELANSSPSILNDNERMVHRDKLVLLRSSQELRCYIPAGEKMPKDLLQFPN